MLININSQQEADLLQNIKAINDYYAKPDTLQNLGLPKDETSAIITALDRSHKTGFGADVYQRNYLYLINVLVAKLFEIEHPACMTHFNRLAKFLSAASASAYSLDNFLITGQVANFVTDHIITETYANKIIGYADATQSWPVDHEPRGRDIIRIDFNRAHVQRGANGRYSLYGLVRIRNALNKGGAFDTVIQLHQLLVSSPINMPLAWKAFLPQAFNRMLMNYLAPELMGDDPALIVERIEMLKAFGVSVAMDSHPQWKPFLISHFLQANLTVLDALLEALAISRQAFDVALCMKDENVNRVKINPARFVASMREKFASAQALLSQLTDVEMKSLPVADFKALVIEAGFPIEWMADKLGSEQRKNLGDAFIADCMFTDMLNGGVGKQGTPLQDYLSLGFNFSFEAGERFEGLIQFDTLRRSHYHAPSNDNDYPFVLFRAEALIKCYSRIHILNHQTTGQRIDHEVSQSLLMYFFTFSLLALKDDYFTLPADVRLGLLSYEDAFVHWMMNVSYCFFYDNTSYQTVMEIVEGADVCRTKVGILVESLLKDHGLKWDRHGFKVLLLEVLKKRPSLRVAALKARVFRLESMPYYKESLLGNLLQSHASDNDLKATKEFKQYEDLCGLNHALCFNDDILQAFQLELARTVVGKPVLALMVIAHAPLLTDDDAIQLIQDHLLINMNYDGMASFECKKGQVFAMLSHDRVNFLKTRLNELILKDQSLRVAVKSGPRQKVHSNTPLWRFLSTGYKSHELKETNHIKALEAHLADPLPNPSALAKWSVFVKVQRPALLASPPADSKRRRLGKAGINDSDL